MGGRPGLAAAAERAAGEQGAERWEGRKTEGKNDAEGQKGEYCHR